MSTIVKCPNCRIEFSVGLGKCPICGRYEAPTDARLAYFEGKATEAFETGADNDSVRASFENAGLTGYEADAAIQSAKRTSRAMHRKTGFGRMVGGLAIAAVAAPLGLLFLSLFGVALFVAGIIQFATGRHMD